MASLVRRQSMCWRARPIPEVLVSGDSKITARGTISKTAGGYEDLSGTTVLFQMRRRSDRRLMINRPAEIESTASGAVSYLLEANDIAIPGNYVIQWQVVYPDGKRQTTRNLEEIEIRRR
jgi:hypothetical protein